jgi:hypothetical protein
VKLSRQLVDTRRRYEGLEALQAETDAQGGACCPHTRPV